MKPITPTKAELVAVPADHAPHIPAQRENPDCLPGQAVELNRVVPPGNMWVAGQQIWLGLAPPGHTAKLSAGLDRVHVLAGGFRVKTLLAGLYAAAVVRIGAGHWLRIPLGKLRNDRYVPLHPELVQLLAAWTAASLEHIRRHKRLVADHRGVLDRHLIAGARRWL